MARFLVEATIDPGRLDVLAARRAEHYAFLVAHQDAIVFGGPARSREGGPPQTMVIVVEAASLDAARAFLDTEPYHRAGGFSSVTVRPWSQVLPEREPGSLRRTLDAERGTGGGPLTR